MKYPQKRNRRTVLRTIGAGMIGGAVITGSTTASANGRTNIDLRGHNFAPNQAKVKLGGESSSAVVRWINDEVKYGRKEFPIVHDVHLHYNEEDLVKSGIYTQMESFVAPCLDDPEEICRYDLGPNFYEVKFREEGTDLVIEETNGKVASKPFPPFSLVEEYNTATIEDWGGSVTLDVHCSIHDKALDVNEGELVTRAIERGEPPYQHRLGFFKMDGGLTITR
jgi:hypothetical protein